MEPDITGTPDFHKLKIEVLRHGLSVRSHAGFFGIGDEDQSAAATSIAKMSKAIDSPFESSDIHIDTEASYLLGPKDYFIRATLLRIVVRLVMVPPSQRSVT